jgi:hypothetical protein
MTGAATFRSRPATRLTRAVFAIRTKFPTECTYLSRRIS